LAPDGRRASGYAPRFVSKPENSRGYRDVERELAKAPGSRRALALGDSFTWGVGVEFDDTKLTELTVVSENVAPIPIYRRPDGSFTNW